MLFLKYLLFVIGFSLLGCAAAVVLYDIYLTLELDRLLRGAAPPAPSPELLPARAVAAKPKRPVRWTRAGRIFLVAVAALLGAMSIVVVPDGQAAVRISQISGVLPGTLYAGTHFLVPLVERVATYDIRDQVFATAATVGARERHEVLTVESQEGLSLGLAVAVRYRIDPRRLDYIQANLPQPIEEEIVAPVVSSALRELAPNYVVRDIFSTKRAEFRERAAVAITKRLGEDAIVVKEVLLRKVQLPSEYAQGLQGLLLKEQEDDRTTVEASIEQKRVKIAESQAEAAKIRQVKSAEAGAQARVIQAKAESDAMQYTLPLKQKQIEQTRLEAEARKEATIKNAEAEAQAKVIDSKAEQERRNLLAQAEANRIRVTSAAEVEKLRAEAEALKVNPLLIQKIIAERLSDKVQIMMVPTDGKFFFTNDVLRSAESPTEDPPAKANGRP